MFGSWLNRWIPAHLLFISIYITSASGLQPWQAPGCHKLAYTRRIEEPGCVIYDAPLYACRGYCQSYAYPSSLLTLLLNPNQIITSRAECCSMEDTEDEVFEVLCVDGYRLFTFKSAKSCACSVCRPR